MLVAVSIVGMIWKHTHNAEMGLGHGPQDLLCLPGIEQLVRFKMSQVMAGNLKNADMVQDLHCS